MPVWLIRVEGVNFDATLFDTNDLSTVRGASLALLRMDVAIGAAFEKAFAPAKVRKVFSGASLAAFTVDCQSTIHTDVERSAREAIETAASGGGSAVAAVLPFLTVVADVVPVPAGDPKKAIEAALIDAEARNHVTQFRSWTVDPVGLDHSALDADPFDGIRPAKKRAPLPKGKVPARDRILDETAPDFDLGLLSPSVHARRRFGRAQRQQFYRDELGATAAAKLGIAKDGPIAFTQSIEDMVAEIGRRKPPLSAARKVAVIYADGNSFGKAKEKTGTEEFARKLQPLRQQLLSELLGWMIAGASHPTDAGLFAIVSEEKLGLRFETLLWGGDEMMFVVPSWLAFPLAKRFFAASRNWAIGGVQLTHAVGIAIADRKTPIRQLKHIAKAAADLAKDAGLREANSLSVEVYESLVPPDEELSMARRRLYGNNDQLARLLALPGGEMDVVEKRMKALRGHDGGDGFPRSQIYGALRAARTALAKAEDGGGLSGPAAARAINEHFEKYKNRAGGTALVETFERNRLPVIGGQSVKRPLALDLALIAQLWDYVHPFERTLDAVTDKRGAA